MKPLLPKQHGAWAMLLIPFLLGVFAGDPVLMHIPLFIGWFFLYLATYPLLMTLKKKSVQLHLKWSMIYLTPALISLILVLIVDFTMLFFGIALIPFFIINIYFAKQNNERSLVNDFSAIIAFIIGGLASYYAGTGSIDHVAIQLAILVLLFFIGSTFFVKTMIREKKNPTYKWISWIFHISVILVLLASGNPWFVLAFIPSLIRAIYMYGKTYTIMKMGILEIINAVYFFITLMIFI